MEEKTGQLQVMEAIQGGDREGEKKRGVVMRDFCRELKALSPKEGGGMRWRCISLTPDSRLVNIPCQPEEIIP